MRMALLLLLAATPAFGQAGTGLAPSAGDRSRSNACMALVRSDPARAVANAQAWRIEGGGAAARHCLALAELARGDNAAALKSFEGAAQASATARDGQAVTIWAQGAEAALLAGQPEVAVRFIGVALAGDSGITLSPRAEAVLRLTRAEALVDLKREAEAAADLALVTARDPAAPTGWLLQATLARRMGDLKLAESAILEAGRRAPEDAAIQYEAGNIAAARGDMTLARTAWTAAAAAEPDSIAGAAAAKALQAAVAAGQ